MLKKYGVDDSKLFKIAVVATMSSGKSTFINSLMGTEILPSQNQACTAKIIPILDNDTANDFKAYIDYINGKKAVITLNNNNVVDSFNEKNEIKQILIEGNIKAIKNHNRAAVIIDTPGTNFSGDSTHQEETYNLLDKLEEGLILYIINATQFGINDDLELMLHIQGKIKKSKNKLKIIFIVNKIDEFDLQKEDIEQTMNSIYEYIEGNGIKSPTVIPISALAAKLFRQAMNGEKLTRREKREFKNYFDLFKNNNYSLNKFAYIDSQNSKAIEIDGENFSEYDLLQAIDNTGISLVENIINELISDNFDKYIPKINFSEELKKENIALKEHITDQVIEQLLKIHNDDITCQKAKKIKAQTQNRKLDEVINKKLTQIYDDAYNESGKIIMECVINKYSDHGRIKKIVDKAFDDIETVVSELETIINDDKKDLQININVIAPMSNGKSTLINAIIGEELLPSKSEACTNTIIRITDNKDLKEFIAECRDVNRNLVYKKKIVNQSDIEKYNENELVNYVDMEGHISNISLQDIKISIIDTPGPNNSKGIDGVELMKRMISESQEDIVLYVINLTQFGINADKAFLDMISSEMKRGDSKAKDRFAFVLNKCDEFDFGYDGSIEQLSKRVIEYLSRYGIEEPNLFPVSAQMAKLIRMKQKGIDLTRRDKRDFMLYEDFIDLEGYHFEKMSSLSESGKMKIKDKLNSAKQEGNEYEEALIHTGIPSLEEYIMEYVKNLY